MSDLLVELLQALDAPQGHYSELERYYQGTQSLAFLSPEAKIALGNRFGRMASNIPRLAVGSLAERLRVTGFSGIDVWADWLRSDLDQLAPVLHREALLYGDGYAIVWADVSGAPRVTVESAKQVSVLTDPGSREVVAAVKRWRTKTTTEAVVYLADRIERYRANTPGAATAGFNLIEVLDNPLGDVPVVQFRNSDSLTVDFRSTGIRVLPPAHSEIWDLIPLVDGLNKTLADLAVAQEFTARPRRWATGIELVERPKRDGDGNPILDGDGQPQLEVINPIPEGNRAMISEAAEARFGQLEGANLSGYEAAVRIWLAQIMAVSALPAHFVGITTENPSSAEALRAAESSLTARAEARQLIFGRAWERVTRLMVAVRDGVDPSAVTATVVWGDPASRSVAAETDAAVKLYQAKLLSRAGTLRRLGLTEDEIKTEIDQAMEEVSAETSAKADPLLTGYFNTMQGN